MSRIEPVQPPYEPQVEEQLARMMPAGASPIGLFRLFVRNLPMTQAIHGWGRYQLGRQLSLSLRQREIVIDRTCALARCEYEWGVHVTFFAERAGLDTAQLRSLTHGAASDDCWRDPRERLPAYPRRGRALPKRRRRRPVVGRIERRLRGAGDYRRPHAVRLVPGDQHVRPHDPVTERAGRPTFASVA